jgi:hypothetical protein
MTLSSTACSKAHHNLQNFLEGTVQQNRGAVGARLLCSTILFESAQTEKRTGRQQSTPDRITQCHGSCPTYTQYKYIYDTVQHSLQDGTPQGALRYNALGDGLCSALPLGLQTSRLCNSRAHQTTRRSATTHTLRSQTPVQYNLPWVGSNRKAYCGSTPWHGAEAEHINPQNAMPWIVTNQLPLLVSASSTSNSY